MGRLGELLVVVVFAALASHVFKTLIHAGFFTHITNHSPGPCRVIEVNGSEDLALLPEGLVFVSSGLRYKLELSYAPEIDERDGKLFTFDFKKPDQDPVELTLKNFNRTGFNPHGLSVYRDPSSDMVSLFVVNHRPDAQAIEIFDFERETHSLILRRSVVDKMIWCPNDLYAVGPDSFYVTNDNFFHFDNTFLNMIQRFFLHHWLRGNIVFFDGFKGIEVFGRIQPNGISLDETGRFVFAADHSSQSVAVFRRRQDNTLEASQTIEVGTLVDNINLDLATGNLWLAGIPRALDLTKQFKNLSHPCPSQIMTLQLGEPSLSGKAFPDYEVREVYLNDGKELSGATSGIVYKDRLLIGSAVSNLLYCEVKFY